MPFPEPRLAQIRRITAVIFLLAFFTPVFPQQQDGGEREKRRVELIYCELLIDDIRSDLRRLIGKVALKHKEILMTCDSAYLYSNSNRVRAFSNVHIEQGDTLDLYGDYLLYDGVKETASLEGNVVLVDKETRLFTESVDYDVKTKVATYNRDGKITNGDNTLTSRIGIYYANDKMFHFKDSVKIVNPDYVMKADTMQYNTETETAFFMGPSRLSGDSIYIYCEKGWYDTKNDVSRLWKNALIDNRQQVVTGDSLYYDDAVGYGEAWRNISITDTTNRVIVKGDYAWYYKDPEKFLVTKKAVFIQLSDNDSLYLHADTISAVSMTDTTGSRYRLMRAYHGCRIFSNEFQSKCDSLSYSFQDSVIRLYIEPVIWSQENQLTSDSIAVFTRNSKADRMELYNSAFITSQVDSIRYNQIKGRRMTGLFRDNSLYTVKINGNGETIYYLLDRDKLTGVNHAKSSSIEIFIDNGKITDIIEFQNPEGTLDPPLKNPPEKMKLEGFSWYELLRPKDREDIFRK